MSDTLNPGPLAVQPQATVQSAAEHVAAVVASAPSPPKPAVLAAANKLAAAVAQANAPPPVSAPAKPLIQSKSPWISMAGTIAGLVAAYFANAQLPAGLPQWAYVVLPCVGTLAAAFAVRSVTSAPISGIVSTP